MRGAWLEVETNRRTSENAPAPGFEGAGRAPGRRAHPPGADHAFAVATRGPLPRAAAGDAAALDAAPHIVHDVLGTAGAPLDADTLDAMQRRLGADLSATRVHTDERAAASAHAVNALAYTVGNSIVFARGRFAPHHPEGRDLLAHELVHTVQQGGCGPPPRGQRLPIDAADSAAETQARRIAHESAGDRFGRPARDGGVGSEQSPHRVAGTLAGPRSPADRTLRRAVQFQEFRRGQATATANAFGRRGELVERLNRQGSGVLFSLMPDGRTLTHQVIEPGAVSPFGRQMIDFLTRPAVVPMRLVQRVRMSVFIDQFELGIVDIEDMLACSDASFQLNMIHILTERLAVPDYAQRLDTGLGPTFAAAHRLGVQAEVTHLRTILRDPTIEFVGETEPDRGRASFIYRSGQGYTVRHVLTTRPGGVTGGEVLIRERGSRTDIPIEAFIARRRPAPTPA